MKKKPRTGRTPDVLRKSGPMDDRTKYDRKRRPNESIDELTDEEMQQRRSEMRDSERLRKN